MGGILEYFTNPIRVRDVSAGSGQHGDAHFMSENEMRSCPDYTMQKIGKEGEPGFVVGTINPAWVGAYINQSVVSPFNQAEKHPADTFVVDTSDQSALLVAPPGTGKSTSVIIPNAVYNARVNKNTDGAGASMVFVSVKHDLYKTMYGELKDCGYRILKLDLRDVYGSNGWNIMYGVNAAIDSWRAAKTDVDKTLHFSEAERYAKVVAQAIVGEVGPMTSEGSAYFTETSRGLITGLVLLVSIYAAPAERHIVSVFQLIMELGCPDEKRPEVSKLSLLLKAVQDRHIKGYISTTTNADIRTTLNVVSSAMGKLLKFIDSELEQLICFHDNAFNAQSFIQEPTAIFLIAPDENETRHFLASLFVRFLTDDLISLAEKSDGKLSRPFYYFLDEFGNFPAIPGVTSLFSAIRSRGGRIMCVVQSYAQFELKYDRRVTEVIKDNCQIMMSSYVSPSAQSTAKAISEGLGNETILSGSSSYSERKKTTSKQLIGRPLVSLSQMVRIPKDTWILQKAGQAPAKVYLAGYWKYLRLVSSIVPDEEENRIRKVEVLEADILRAKLAAEAAAPEIPRATKFGRRRSQQGAGNTLNQQ